jgi:hypothetical protein
VGVILILGRREDPCCRVVHDQLLAAGRDVCLLAEDQLLPGLGFEWRPSSVRHQGSIYSDGREIDFTDIDGIFSRAWGVPVSAQDFETADGRYICAEWNALLMAWLHGMPCVVINRVRPELWYKAQLNVADLASLLPGIPLRLPQVLVTTNLDDANEFCRSVPGRVRYSPLTQSSGYRIQTEDDKEQLAALVGSLPLYLTEWAEGRTVDAFVVGSEVIFVDQAGQISNASPVPVAAYCAKAADALGLAFCKLSLVAGANGHWYCFGADRTPQLYRCSIETQTDIAQALVRSLCATSESR